MNCTVCRQSKLKKGSTSIIISCWEIMEYIRERFWHCFSFFLKLPNSNVLHHFYISNYFLRQILKTFHLFFYRNQLKMSVCFLGYAATYTTIWPLAIRYLFVFVFMCKQLWLRAHKGQTNFELENVQY